MHVRSRSLYPDADIPHPYAEMPTVLTVDDVVKTGSAEYRESKARIDALLQAQRQQDKNGVPSIVLRLGGVDFQSEASNDFFIVMHALSLTMQDIKTAIEQVERDIVEKIEQ